METNKAVVTQQERNVTDGVLSRIQALTSKGDLFLPKKYSAENALKSAWLILQGVQDKSFKPALQVCTQNSVANALMDMAVQGLNPMKKQCYFMVFGDKLTCMRSYMGSAAIVKRQPGVLDVYANIIYEGDEFDYELDLDTGLKKITKHKQKFENIDSTKIVGAYAVVVKEDKKNYIDIMNIGQIKKSWGQGTAYSSGKSTAHNNFTEEMARKTVINRACKMFINTSDDSDLLLDTFDRTDDEKTYDDKDLVSAEFEVKEEIKEKANSKPLDLEPAIETKPPTVENPDF